MKILSRLFLLAIICLFSTSLLYAASDNNVNIPRLMLATPMLAFDSFSESGGSAQTLLEVDPQVLNDLSKNRLNRVAIPAIDREVIFDKTSQKIRSKTSTWIGRGDGGNSRVVLTIGSDHFFGRLVTADTIIFFEPGQMPSQVISTVVDPAFEMPLAQDQVIAPQPVQTFFATPEPSDDGTRIDVMVLYTDGMADDYPGSQIDTRIQQLIDLANLSFTNSNINTQYHLVYSQEVDYPDNTGGNQGSVDDMEIALNDLTTNNDVFGNIETLRTVYGADQVTLLRRFVDEGCGLAWLLRWGDDADLAYAVVHDGFKTDGSGYYCSNLTYAHEIGHNLGCAHDPDHSSVPGRFAYSYGYQDPGEEFRTVMSYNCPGGCPREEYFSNPDVMYNGKATGIVDSADNARTINQTRVGMAGYRDAVSIAVTSPNNPEQWARSTSKTITWTSANISGNVTIELYRNDVFDGTITSSTSNTGNFVWVIPSDQPLDSTYRIRISNETYPDIYDESDNDFSITEAPSAPASLPWINLLLIMDD